MKVLWSLLLVFCLVYGLQFSAASYEDAKELVSSFKGIVDSPVAKDLKLFHLFAGNSALFLRRIVPFGEFMATALKITLEEDKLENLLKLTNGINRKLTDVKKQLDYIIKSTTYYPLLNDYRRDIVIPIFSLLGHIGTMSHHRMNVSEDIIRAFKNKCLETNEPSVIAKKMEQIASDCTNTRLDATLMSRIYTLINNFTYDIYDLNKESKQLFDHRLTIIYSHLAASSNMSHKFSIILKFRRENKGRNFADKPQMLLALMTEFELNDEHRIETNCLPFDAFQTSGYRMDAITRFGATFMQDYYSLPEQADYFTRRVEQILEPVTEFIDKWFVQTLDSTWPEMERTLVQNIIFDFAKNADIPENNETYAQLVDKIYKDMEPIGHPGYSRQYIVTKAWRYDTYSMQFGYGCKPNRCTVASSMDAHCTMLRVDTSTNRALVNFDNLLNFSNTSFPTFFNAMNTEFYEMYFVSNVVDKLGKNYGLYLDRFNNHSSFVILRYFQYFKGCANTYAIKPTKDLGYEFIQLWTYHTDGGLTTDCEHWNVFLTN